ncbi:MAG: hypothetical protein J4F34_07850 [Gemmatimonadetes bacterium]|nr:hypothetical protein [Gemmatimonadota bacterium]
MTSVQRSFAIGAMVSLQTVYGDIGGDGGTQSAGVQQDAWIDTVPLVVIGDDPQDPLHRVIGAVLVGDTLIVAQASSSALRFYDQRTGDFLRRVGGTGEGPGEYKKLSSLQRVGERLYTYDVLSRRVTAWDLSGAPKGTVNIEYWAPYRIPQLVGVFADGSFLIAAKYRNYDDPARSPMFRRDVMVLGRYGTNGILVDSLGYYLGAERYVAPNERGGQTHGQSAPFGRGSLAGVIGGGYYILDNKVAMISVFDTAGSLVREFGPDTPLEPVRISREDRGRFSGFDDIAADGLPQFYPFYGDNVFVDGATFWIPD